MSQLARRTTTVTEEYTAPEPEISSTSGGGGSFNIFKLIQWLLFTGEGLFFCGGIAFAVFLFRTSPTNPPPQTSPPVNNIIINN